MDTMNTTKNTKYHANDRMKELKEVNGFPVCPKTQELCKNVQFDTHLVSHPTQENNSFISDRPEHIATTSPTGIDSKDAFDAS